MAVCNLFNEIKNTTGTFLTFSQYYEDLTKETGTGGTYHIIPSKFVAMNINFGNTKSNIKTLTNEDDYNRLIPTYLQNYFENGCAICKSKINNWDPTKSSNLFWRALFDAGWLSISSNVVNEIQYVGDISIQNHSIVDGMGYSEIYCHIPNDAPKTKYRAIVLNNDNIIQSTPAGIVVGYKASDVADLNLQVQKYDYHYEQTYIIKDITNNDDNIGEENTVINVNSFPINCIVILYDIKTYNSNTSKYDTIYSNIPMGIYFPGTIKLTGDVNNTIIKYVSNEDIYDNGTSYGIRICSRFVNNLSDNSLNIKSEDYNGINVVLSKLNETLSTLNDISSNIANNSQNDKELLSLFKNSRTNVPYIKTINGVSYWFVNGRNTGIQTSSNNSGGGIVGGGSCNCDRLERASIETAIYRGLSALDNNEVIKEPLPSPTITCTATANSITMQWVWDDRAAYYIVKCENDVRTINNKVANVVFNNLIPGTNYMVSCQAYPEDTMTYDNSAITAQYVRTSNGSGGGDEPDEPNEPDDQQLSTPSNITHEYNFENQTATISWDHVRGATGYYIILTNKNTDTARVFDHTNNSITIENIGKEQEYTFSIKAVDQNGKYKESSFANYEFQTYTSIKKLDTPSNVIVGNNGSQVTIKWDYVQGATGYIISITNNGYTQEYENDKNSFAFTVQGTNTIEYDIKVKAISTSTQYETSEWSDVKTFEYNSNINQIVLDSLKDIELTSGLNKITVAYNIPENHKDCVEKYRISLLNQEDIIKTEEVAVSKDSNNVTVVFDDIDACYYNIKIETIPISNNPLIVYIKPEDYIKENVPTFLPVKPVEDLTINSSITSILVNWYTDATNIGGIEQYAVTITGPNDYKETQIIPSSQLSMNQDGSIYVGSVTFENLNPETSYTISILTLAKKGYYLDGEAGHNENAYTQPRQGYNAYKIGYYDPINKNYHLETRDMPSPDNNQIILDYQYRDVMNTPIQFCVLYPMMFIDSILDGRPSVMSSAVNGLIEEGQTIDFSKDFQLSTKIGGSEGDIADFEGDDEDFGKPFYFYYSKYPAIISEPTIITYTINMNK